MWFSGVTSISSAVVLVVSQKLQNYFNNINESLK